MVRVTQKAAEYLQVLYFKGTFRYLIPNNLHHNLSCFSYSLLCTKPQVISLCVWTPPCTNLPYLFITASPQIAVFYTATPAIQPDASSGENLFSHLLPKKHHLSSSLCDNTEPGQRAGMQEMLVVKLSLTPHSTMSWSLRTLSKAKTICGLIKTSIDPLCICFLFAFQQLKAF